jgi:hypothetical protein
MIVEDKSTNDGGRWTNYQLRKMSQLTMAKIDQPTEMVCTGEENIMDKIMSTTDAIFYKPLFILLAK